MKGLIGVSSGPLRRIGERDLYLTFDREQQRFRRRNVRLREQNSTRKEWKYKNGHSQKGIQELMGVFEFSPL